MRKPFGQPKSQSGDKLTPNEMMKSLRLGALASITVFAAAFVSPASAGLFVLNAEGTLTQRTFPPNFPIAVPVDPALLEGATFRVTISGDATQPPASGGPGQGGQGKSFTYDDLQAEVSLTDRAGGAADADFSPMTSINLRNSRLTAFSDDAFALTIGSGLVNDKDGNPQRLTGPTIDVDFGRPDFFPGDDNDIPELPAFDFADVTATFNEFRYDADGDGNPFNDFVIYEMDNFSISSRVVPSQVVPEPSMLLTWVGLAACGLPLRRRRGLRS